MLCTTWTEDCGESLSKFPAAEKIQPEVDGVIAVIEHVDYDVREGGLDLAIDGVQVKPDALLKKEDGYRQGADEEHEADDKQHHRGRPHPALVLVICVRDFLSSYLCCNQAVGDQDVTKKDDATWYSTAQ